MTKDEHEQLCKHAELIAYDILSSADYSYVYENEELMELNLSGTEMRYIFSLVLNATVDVRRG